MYFFLQQYFRELCLETIKTKLNDLNHRQHRGILPEYPSTWVPCVSLEQFRFLENTYQELSKVCILKTSSDFTPTPFNGEENSPWMIPKEQPSPVKGLAESLPWVTSVWHHSIQRWLWFLWSTPSCRPHSASCSAQLGRCPSSPRPF